MGNEKITINEKRQFLDDLKKAENAIGNMTDISLALTGMKRIREDLDEMLQDLADIRDKIEKV